MLKKWMHYIRIGSWTEDKLRVVSPYFRLLNSDPSLISSAAAAAAGALPNLLLINFINIEYARIGIRSTQRQWEKINLRSVCIWFTWTSDDWEEKKRRDVFAKVFFIDHKTRASDHNWLESGFDAFVVEGERYFLKKSSICSQTSFKCVMCRWWGPSIRNISNWNWCVKIKVTKDQRRELTRELCFWRYSIVSSARGHCGLVALE